MPRIARADSTGVEPDCGWASEDRLAVGDVERDDPGFAVVGASGRSACRRVGFRGGSRATSVEIDRRCGGEIHRIEGQRDREDELARPEELARPKTLAIFVARGHQRRQCATASSPSCENPQGGAGRRNRVCGLDGGSHHCGLALVERHVRNAHRAHLDRPRGDEPRWVLARSGCCCTDASRAATFGSGSHPRADDGCDHDLPCRDEGRHGATQWSDAGRSEAGRDGDISADGARARPGACGHQRTCRHSRTH